MNATYYYLTYYTFMLCIIYFGLQISERMKTNKYIRNIITAAVTIPLLIDSHFRENRGTDTLEYRYYFENFIGYLTPTDSLGSIVALELGYTYIAHYLANNGVTFEWFSVFVSILILFFLTGISDAYNIKRRDFFLYYFLSSFWFFTYNGIRQAIAISVIYFLLASYEKIDKKVLIYLMLIAVLFHSSSILIVLLILILSYTKHLYSRVSKLSVFTLIVFLIVLANFGVEFLVDSLGYSRYLERFYEANNIGFGIGWSIQVVINIITLYIIYLKKEDVDIIIIFSLIWIILYALFAYNMFAMRLAQYFFLAQIVYLARSFQNCQGRIRQLRIIVLPLYVILFIGSILGNSNGIVQGYH
jgi:hypothetical protein